MSQLATRTWVDYQRNAFAAPSEEIGQTVQGDERSDSQKAVKYRDAHNGVCTPLREKTISRRRRQRTGRSARGLLRRVRAGVFVRRG